MTSNLSLRGILDANKLTGPNFLDWYRNLRIVLKQEKKSYVLDIPVPELPEDATEEDQAARQTHLDDLDLATCIMLASMTPELQKQHETMNGREIIQNLRELFDKESRTERFDISKELFHCKLPEGSPVRPHVLKIIGFITRLSRLGWDFDHDLTIDLVLASLPPSYGQFVMNFQMNRIEVTLAELLNMLTTAEKSVKKDKSSVLLISTSNRKKKRETKRKKEDEASTSKAKKPKGVERKQKDKEYDICHHCGKHGHWKRNCRDYMKSMKDKKQEKASNPGMF